MVNLSRPTAAILALGLVTVKPVGIAGALVLLTQLLEGVLRVEGPRVEKGASTCNMKQRIRHQVDVNARRGHSEARCQGLRRGKILHERKHQYMVNDAVCDSCCIAMCIRGTLAC